MSILRGQIWAVDLGLSAPGEKFHVIVSANGRNASAYPWVHVARITGRRPAHPVPADVELPGGLAYSGWVKCDELMPVRKERLRRQVAALPPRAHAAD